MEFQAFESGVFRLSDESLPPLCDSVFGLKVGCVYSNYLSVQFKLTS